MFWTADKGQIEIQVYTSLYVSFFHTNCGDIHFRSYVNTGFELGKTAIQLTEDQVKKCLEWMLNHV